MGRNGVFRPCPYSMGLFPSKLVQYGSSSHSNSIYSASIYAYSIDIQYFHCMFDVDNVSLENHKFQKAVYIEVVKPLMDILKC